ncbi:hypothetical protein F4775DRAFT_565378 [Biscogniauxia sp. FL1348]|nr:hypothetical protein F4775DRAFT_565378 [Biscogniauxia sp. FL1348]
MVKNERPRRQRVSRRLFVGSVVGPLYLVLLCCCCAAALLRCCVAAFLRFLRRGTGACDGELQTAYLTNPAHVLAATDIFCLLGTRLKVDVICR